MFTVTDKEVGGFYKVYGISEVGNKPMFLLYIDGNWVWMFAEYYKPIEGR